MTSGAPARLDVQFQSGGVRCAAWHYATPRAEPAPCIVMAHGFGAVKEGRLAAYAERFQGAGLGVLVFDYRHFGGSEGEPRHLVDTAGQLDDWTSAIAFAQTLEGVDTARMALWGTSYSGGHVITLAARDPGIACVIAQVPHTSGIATCRAAGLRASVRLTIAGVRDVIRAARRTEPFYVRTAGPPGSLAALTSPDADSGYHAMYPEGYEPPEEVAARVLLRVPTYSPGRKASRVRCPLLVQVAEHDAVTPPGPAIRAAERAPLGELIAYPIGHFEIYRGGPFERAVTDQVAFLRRHL